jgi:transcriptional regulator with XRE-family HTH domain
MGYRGKVREQEQARTLRARGKTLAEIAAALGVSKSSVSLWVRDVPFTPSKRRYGAQRRRNPLQERRLREIEELNRAGTERLGALSEAAFLAAGVALYAGEGAKRDHAVIFANSDPAMVRFFCTWLRKFFEIDESRLRVNVYLHQGLDLEAAEAFWSNVTNVPRAQFRKPYRAVPDASIRRTKHRYGCVYVRYSCSRTHRAVMGLVRALLSSTCYSGVAQLAAQLAVNETVAGSSPAPGAKAQLHLVPDPEVA